MSIVRRDDRPVLMRGPGFPALQRLVDRAGGPAAVTVLINTFTGGEAVPEHIHEVEEVLLVTASACTVIIDGRPEAVRMGDAVIIDQGPVTETLGVVMSGSPPDGAGPRS
jgi:quercetin dioxygenase-like cupin family protein